MKTLTDNGLAHTHTRTHKPTHRQLCACIHSRCQIRFSILVRADNSLQIGSSLNPNPTLTAILIQTLILILTPLEIALEVVEAEEMSLQGQITSGPRKGG